ncbi:LacI family DNA-binding transcriptional regulator [Treponema sp.]
MANGKEIRLAEIAKQAHVSISTVSRILNNEARVSDDIRERVERVIQSMGYERKSPKRNSNHFLAFICPNIANPFFASLIKGTENVTKTHGFNLILYDSEDDPRIASKNIDSALKIGVSGFIYIATTGDDLSINRAILAGVPVVFLDRKLNIPQMSYVGSDNRSGAYQAVKYLIALGHERIVYLSGPRDISTEEERFEGYLDAHKECGLPVENSLFVSADYHMESAHSNMKLFMRANPVFSAIFATNDLMAFGARQAIEEVGKQIPEDVSIVGYDDISVSTIVHLTTVTTPTYEMGKNAALLLEDLIMNRKTAPQTVILQPSLRIRSSCIIFDQQS